MSDIVESSVKGYVRVVRDGSKTVSCGGPLGREEVVVVGGYVDDVMLLLSRYR